MSRYRLTRKANADLLDIWSYIALHNPEAADRVEAAIYGACTFLAEAPMRGHTRTDLTKLPVRFWSIPRYSKYMIVYDPVATPLKIIRILHGSRDFCRQMERK